MISRYLKSRLKNPTLLHFLNFCKLQIYKGIAKLLHQSLTTTVMCTLVLVQMDEEKNYVYVLINFYTKIISIRYFFKANREKSKWHWFKPQEKNHSKRTLFQENSMNQSSVGKKAWFFFLKNQPTKNALSQSFYLISIMSKSGVSNLRKSLEIEFQIISCRI